MDSAKFKKMLLHLLPAALFAFIGNIVSFSVRNTAGHDISDKFMSFIDILSNKLTIPLPSLHWIDLLVGLASGAAFYGLWRLKKSNAKQFRSGKEHGSARWGTVEESKALRAKRFCDNLIITATLWIASFRHSSASSSLPVISRATDRQSAPYCFSLSEIACSSRCSNSAMIA